MVWIPKSTIFKVTLITTIMEVQPISKTRESMAEPRVVPLLLPMILINNQMIIVSVLKGTFFTSSSSSKIKEIKKFGIMAQDKQR